MSELIVEVCEIKEVKPHPDPETTSLEIAVVKGWESVVRKDSYKVGDPCVFVPPDAILSTSFLDLTGSTKYCAELPKSHELRSTHRRVKAARIRNYPSYGLLLGMDVLPSGDYVVGQGVGHLLGVSKWVPPVKIQCEDAEPEDTLFHRYTSIENYKNYPDYFVEGEPVVFTEKIHGCLHKDSLISVRMGSGDIAEMPISHIKIGDIVVSHDGNKYVEDEVTNVIVQKHTSKWLKLEFDNGRSLVCTEHHQILTTDGWVEAKSLTDEHTIL